MVTLPRVFRGSLIMGGLVQHPQQKAVPMNLGLDDAQRIEIVEGLSQVLADAFALYLKTHHYHWNVTGPMFQTLHTLFEEQYTEQWAALDLIAERIRALGAPAPGALPTLVRLATIKDDERVPDAMEMVRQLLAGHETVIRAARKLFAHTEDANDPATGELLTARLQAHEKSAWMLRSLLK